MPPSFLLKTLTPITASSTWMAGSVLSELACSSHFYVEGTPLTWKKVVPRTISHRQ